MMLKLVLLTKALLSLTKVAKIQKIALPLNIGKRLFKANDIE